MRSLLLVAFLLGQAGQPEQGQSSRAPRAPLMRVLPGGPNAGQVAAGGLTSTNGIAINDTRASTKSCNGSTLLANQICVDTTGIRVDSADSIASGSKIPSGHTPSFSLDFKPDSGASGSTQFLLQLENSGADRWDMFVQGGGQLGCDYFNGSGHTVTTTATVSSGVIHHASCSYDGATLKVCLDGTCVSSSQSFTASAVNYTAAFGRDVADNGTPLAGWERSVCFDYNPARCR